MRYIYLIITLVLTNFCEKNIYTSNNNIQTFDKRCGDFITLDCEKVYSDITINAISLEKIIATVTIFNDSTETIWLYKPLLPQGNLSGESFNILDVSKLKELFPRGFKPFDDRRYPEDTVLKSYLLTDIADSNLIQLTPFTKCTFQMNLSDKFDFNYFLQKKIDTCMIGFVASMPYTLNWKHVTQKDECDNNLKPVFLGITCKSPDVTELKRVKVRIPKS